MRGDKGEVSCFVRGGDMTRGSVGKGEQGEIGVGEVKRCRSGQGWCQRVARSATFCGLWRERGRRILWVEAEVEVGRWRGCQDFYGWTVTISTGAYG